MWSCSCIARMGARFRRSQLISPSNEAQLAPRSSKYHKLISQTVARGRTFALRWISASFPFRYKRAGAERRGKNSEASDVSLGSRVRSPSSAGRHPAGIVPGEAEVGNHRISRTSEREDPGGEALIAVWFHTPRERRDDRLHRKRSPHRRTRGRIQTYVIHHGQARRRCGCCACSVLWDWACWRHTSRGGRAVCMGSRSAVRERRQLEDQHRQWFLRRRAVRRGHLARVRRKELRQPGASGKQAQQIAIARRVLAGQGPGAWPVCSRRAGLTKSNGKADRNASPTTNPGASKTQNLSDSKVKIAKKLPKKKYSSTGKTVHVGRGDTLRKIAKRYHVEGGWKGLWKLNKETIKDSNLIYIGQILKIK